MYGKLTFVQNSIGIIGHGFVGKALEYGFKNGPIFIFDKFKETLSLDEVCEKSEFIFICVPTPMFADDSGIDLSIVEEVVDQIAKKIRGTDKILIIKSTSVPGTTKAFIEKYPGVNIANNPEFLTEKNYMDDFVNADRVVIGALDKKISRRIADLYKKHLPEVPVFETDPTSAEMVKYVANTFLATKVLFAYEMYDMCQTLGIDYMRVKEMVVADHRIYDSHLNVKESDTANSNTTDRKGFGGKCFPKDIAAFIGLAKKLDVDFSLLECAWETNKRIRKVHDWVEIPGAVSSKK